MSYMRLLDGPYRSERQRMAEERQKKAMIERAQQTSDVLRKIEHERTERKAQAKLLFALWVIVDTRLQRLEDQRNAHKPKSIDDEWDTEFCQAVEEIPGVKRLCDDLWYAWSNINRPEFAEWV